MGYAAPGDYLDYLVYVPEAGNYKFNFRIASQRSNSQIIIRIGEEDSFTGIDTITIPSTGGWQNWQTTSSTTYLPEGRYTLRNYVRSGEFNTNWFQAVKEPTTAIETAEINDFQIYPNPAKGFVTIETNNLNSELKNVSFYNTSGQVVKQFKIMETGTIRIDISDLKEGFYIVELKKKSGDCVTDKLIVK